MIGRVELDFPDHYKHADREKRESGTIGDITFFLLNSMAETYCPVRTETLASKF